MPLRRLLFFIIFLNYYLFVLLLTEILHIFQERAVWGEKSTATKTSLVRTQANSKCFVVSKPKTPKRNPQQFWFFFFHLETFRIQAQESKRLSAQSTTEERWLHLRRQN